jgi:hypothetical protein
MLKSACTPYGPRARTSTLDSSRRMSLAFATGSCATSSREMTSTLRPMLPSGAGAIVPVTTTVSCVREPEGACRDDACMEDDCVDDDCVDDDCVVDGCADAAGTKTLVVARETSEMEIAIAACRMKPPRHYREGASAASSG